jgi:ribosomal protein S18 acetylase RimI-like enzyme
MASPVHVRIRRARPADAGELFTLQRAAWVAEAQRRRDPFLAPLSDDAQELRDAVQDAGTTVLVAAAAEDGEHGRRGRLVGFVRLAVRGTTCRISRVVVAPDLRGRGLGSALLDAVHAHAAQLPGVQHLELSAGTAASEDLALYRRNGYVPAGTRLMRRPVH